MNSGYGYGYGEGPSYSASVSVGTPSPYYVSSMPPEPLYEQMTPSPGYGYSWIDGYWHWNGYEWVWVSGRWEHAQDGYVYVQPYYDYSGGQYVYTPGYWAPHDRVPQGWQVRDHRDGRPPVVAPPSGWHNTQAPTGPVRTGPPAWTGPNNPGNNGGYRPPPGGRGDTFQPTPPRPEPPRGNNPGGNATWNPPPRPERPPAPVNQPAPPSPEPPRGNWNPPPRQEPPRQEPPRGSTFNPPPQPPRPERPPAPVNHPAPPSPQPPPSGPPPSGHGQHPPRR